MTLYAVRWSAVSNENVGAVHIVFFSAIMLELVGVLKKNWS